MLSEKVELLGKGLYKNIPDVLTLKGLPTSSELEYVGSEDFDRTMLETILPSAVEEKINFKELLEIDYQWLCRCLRLLNFGPYHTTNSIFCDTCGRTSYGEFQVNLNTIGCVPMPDGFENKLVIARDNFLDFSGDIVLKLLTMQQRINAYSDKAFQTSDGRSNRELARICYMIQSIDGKTSLTPVEIKMILQRDLSAADYIILKKVVNELSNYGLRAGGKSQCPQCGNKEAAFIALTDDRFFRPTLGDLRQWKIDRSPRTS